MTSCILTVIKNEHEYLDEWVKYHLDLGIDHIFIFEDVESESHKEITDKYGDSVSLDSVLSVLSDEEKYDLIELRNGWKKIRQITYFRNGLEYIKNNHPSYDWCFVIDNDEFITFEEQNKDLKDILSLYERYDAFLMQWKLYGANGIIKKPDYSKRGVVDIFTKESPEFKFRNVLWNLKTCYNMQSFSREKFGSCHYPNLDSDWCKTDFSKNVQKAIYDNIYIRHYVTKSWEEYVWKKTSRGYFFGFSRTLDFFFSLNPELKDRKNELVSMIGRDFELAYQPCTLVVLPYVQSRSQGCEIRKALDCWRKFCQFNYVLVVIGEFATTLIKEYPWVTFILKKRIEKREGQYNPHLDILSKFECVSRIFGNRYDGFIFTCDDWYAIKPFGLEDIKATYYLTSDFRGNEKAPAHFWTHDKWKTRQLLEREGLPHKNYTTHFPYYMEFEKLKEMIEKFNMREESYVFDDVYFNLYDHPEPVQVDKVRLGIWSNNIFKQDFQKAIEDPDIKFVCNSVEGWSQELEDALQKIIDE